MSREHLYRAKRVNWRELPKEEWWVEGNLLISDDDCYIIPDLGVSCVEKLNNFVCDKLITLHAFEVNKETVCEYTGLTDKSGKRFEGYIFQSSDGDYIQRYVITWNEDSLEWSAECIGNPDGTLPLSEFRVGEIEVIGNIFDNPELLQNNKEFDD